jgi:hypothetical protein
MVVSLHVEMAVANTITSFDPVIPKKAIGQFINR